MAREYVPIFFDWLETTQDLSQDEKGNLIDAVVSYAAGKEYEHLLQGSGCRIAFRFLKGQVDRNAAISEARAKAGSSKKEQEETKPSKPDQTESKSKKQAKKFEPPTLEEITKYCDERGNHVDPVKFYNYYCSNGWKVGKNQMKDWKATIHTWERSEWTEKEYQERQARLYDDLPM